MIPGWLYASIFSLLLAACGGGGGGSDPQADSGAGSRPPAENPQPPSSGGGGEDEGSEVPSPEPTPSPEPQPPSSDGGNNGSGDSGGSDGDAGGDFAATVTMAPEDGALLEGAIRLEVRGSGLENVELLPAEGYEPKYGVFTISSDKTHAYLDVSTEDLPEGTFYARISAFNGPAGSTTAREIIAMPARQWETPLANGTPPPGPLTDIRFTNPSDIAADANGNLYVVDGDMYVLDGEDYNGQIRQIAPDGSIKTLVSEDGFTITALTVTPTGDVFYSKSEDPYGRAGAIWQIENGTPVRVTSEEVAISDMVFDPSSGNLYVGVWTPDGPEVKAVRQDGSVTTLFSIDEDFGAPVAMTVHNGVLWFGW